MRNLFKMLMLVVILLTVALPLMAEETPEATNEPVEIITLDNPVVTIGDEFNERDYGLIGMVLIAVTGFVYAIVDGFKTGRLVQGLTRASDGLLNNVPLNDEIDRRLAGLDPETRGFVNSVINVADPLTQFSFTDMDDKWKARLRQWFDGEVQSPFVGGADFEIPVEPIAEG